MYRLFIFVFFVFVLSGCEKSTPTKGGDPRIDSSKYCNDPLAINYNYGFPGRPDNTICIYPVDLFQGTYTFTDTIRDGDYFFDTAATNNIITREITILPRSQGDKNLFILRNFCGNNNELLITADRFYKATLDSTASADTLQPKIGGQFLCRGVTDTISGYIIKSKTDTTLLYVNFLVASDTNINFHTGTAKKK